MTIIRNSAVQYYNHDKIIEDLQELPEWVTIYYLKQDNTEYKCNICEVVLIANEKSMKLLDHIKINHKEVYELHKENPESSVGFHIEFLHLNVLKDDEGDPETQPVIIGEVCEATTEEMTRPIIEEEVVSDIDHQIVLTTKKKKIISLETRRRSWVWKYFTKMNNTMYKCNLCNIVLSIKGCNTNNMNRHIKTKHPGVFQSEISVKKDHSKDDLDQTGDSEALKVSDISVEDKDDDILDPTHLKRRSWVWSYFIRISSTLAQCKLCKRSICHGGNATGNMNRHLKMIHNKTGEDNKWVWKVFDCDHPDFYICKICQYKCVKFRDINKSICHILQHLKVEHGVISGGQIITGTL
ncbi:uncharacterized protein ACR2FA_011955 [Aphomia sociella]